MNFISKIKYAIYHTKGQAYEKHPFDENSGIYIPKFENHYIFYLNIYSYLRLFIFYFLFYSFFTLFFIGLLYLAQLIILK